MDFSQITQKLADIHIATIFWSAAVLTVGRLALLKFSHPLARVLLELVEAALIAGVLVYLIIQPFVIKPFYIPSGSMKPTLIEDDHVMVNNFEYRFGSPHHGDVIVFNAPERALELSPEPRASDGNPTDYIKRLIGLPGDVIQVFAGTVQIGDRYFTHSSVRQAYGLLDPDNQHVKFTDSGAYLYDGHSWTFHDNTDLTLRLTEVNDQPVIMHPGYVERNGAKIAEPYIAEDPDYSMKLLNGQSFVEDTEGNYELDGMPVSDPQLIQLYTSEPPGKVPAGDVFAMGDNRNDSSDGHAWGPLDEHRLVGRAFVIFYPFNRIRWIH